MWLKINPFNIKAVMLDLSHQCCIENAHLRRLVWVFVARCKYQNIMELYVRFQKNTGFSSNTGSPEKSQLRSQHSMLGIHRHAINGVSLAGWWWDLDPPSPNQLKKKRCQSWIPSDKAFWIRAWIMSVDSLISIEPVQTHCMHAWIQNILSEGVVREDRNATKNGPPSAHQRNAFVDNGPPLNAGLVALWFLGDPNQYC